MSEIMVLHGIASTGPRSRERGEGFLVTHAGAGWQSCICDCLRYLNPLHINVTLIMCHK